MQKTVFQIITFGLVIVWLIAVLEIFLAGDRYIYVAPHHELTGLSTAAVHQNTAVSPSSSTSSKTKNKKVNQQQVPVQVSANGRPVLLWPPLTNNNTIPSGDGEETMPYMGLKVPRFYEAPLGMSLDDVGRKVNGQETIFVMIASYRDFQCRETIDQLFKYAKYPDRLFVGAVDQVVPGDVGCLDVEVPCSTDPSQAICRHRDQIVVFNIDATLATGPVTARHIGDRLYRGETYAMQLDAHCHFVKDWDIKLESQFLSTGNQRAVLTSYLSDAKGSLTEDHISKRNTRPIMCNSDYEGNPPERYLRHGAQPETEPDIQGMPQLEPYWAAGFSFSRGHFKMRVPYDAYQPMVFQGEEIAISVRGFTHGYDFYAPNESVIFHEYAVNSNRRSKIHTFWENNNSMKNAGKRSLARATSIIALQKSISPNAWDHSELDKYGLGTVRPVDEFYRLFLIDRDREVATQICPFVRWGDMHRNFQPYLRPDGLGIDYSKLTNFDTTQALEKSIIAQQPGWIKMIEDSMKSGDSQGLRFALDGALRFKVDRIRPELISAARKKLQG